MKYISAALCEKVTLKENDKDKVGKWKEERKKNEDGNDLFLPISHQRCCAPAEGAHS